jgi:NIMA (never in mitosis gene a)-related kinase
LQESCAAAELSSFSVNCGCQVRLNGLNQRQLTRTQDEVRFLKRLQHPHLIAYRASFLEQTLATLYILMEYAGGGDLKSRIEKQAALGAPASQRFDEALVLRWLVQCVSALYFCHHTIKLLHRDIKPANIFLTSKDDVKIGDFGLSKALAASNMQANTRVGSPLYMSPELCQGKPYDRGADVWSTTVDRTRELRI